MLDCFWTSNETIQLFTNSAGGQYRNFDIYFQGKWAQHCWPKEWAENGMLSDITFLELFPVVVAVNIWGLYLKNKNIVFNIDNQSVVYIVSKKMVQVDKSYVPCQESCLVYLRI